GSAPLANPVPLDRRRTLYPFGHGTLDAGTKLHSPKMLDSSTRQPGGARVPFEIVQKPAFYHDLVSLPRDVLASVSTAVRHISADPFNANGHAKPCFKERYRNLYRYRLKKDYRIIYSV